jgi:hypothetical protein
MSGQKPKDDSSHREGRFKTAPLNVSPKPAAPLASIGLYKVIQS